MIDDINNYNQTNSIRLPNLNHPDKRASFIEHPFNLKRDRLKFEPSIQNNEPDWTPDFSEKIDVVGDSIKLALNLLKMSIEEYNSLDLSELQKRRIGCFNEQMLALNILIHYKKKNTIGNILGVNPIKHTN